MENFDEVCNNLINSDNEILEEGILNRASEKIKNIGRSIEHPWKRMFGKDDEAIGALATTRSGYLKIKTLQSVLIKAIDDLKKLKVIRPESNTKELVSDIGHILDELGAINFSKEKDITELGQKIRAKVD